MCLGGGGCGRGGGGVVVEAGDWRGVLDEIERREEKWRGEEGEGTYY